MSTADHDVAEIEEKREQLKESARAAAGVTGTSDAPPLRETIRESGVGWYTLIALGVLVIVDEFQTYGLLVLGPEVAAALGIEKELLGGLQALKTVALALATLPMAAFVQKGKARGAISFLTGVAWGALMGLTSLVANVWGLLAVMVGDGASTGSVRAIHPSLLADSYPPEVRSRGFSFYQSANYSGLIIAPLAIAGLTTLGMTWRGVFLSMGIASLAAAFIAARLRDPGFGRFDTSRVRATVRVQERSDEQGPGTDEVRLGFFEIVRRLLLIPTIRKIFLAYMVVGMLIVPLFTFLFFFLDEEWGLGATERGLFFAAIAPISILAVAILARRGDVLFRRDPAKVMDLCGALLAMSVTLLAAAGLVNVFGLMFVLFGVAIALLVAVVPPLYTATLSIVQPGMRPHAAALASIFQALFGGFAGLLLLGGMENRFGPDIAIASLAIPGIVAGFVLRAAGKTIGEDFDRMIGEIVEEEELKQLQASGARLPMLACRHIDFSYGRLQVLFDVSFTVDEGEIVALLGTNGAGKSTLLKVMSGIGLPSGGSVRLDGADITYVDAERRVGLGINQIASADTVFRPLTVAENLQMFAYKYGNGSGERAIKECLEVFPRLGERQGQLANTLSGGEQQMLSLAKAFVIKPRLLLIDELSLGLAPKIVGELLEIVRRMNAEGSAIVLVEQSVNVALSLVDHAYFMEKGEIRFDGPAKELLTRHDLLRSVFLKGAGAGLEQR